MNVRIVARHFCGNVMRRLVFSRRYSGEGRGDGGAGGEEEEHVEAIFDVLAHQFAFCLSDYVTWLRRLDLDGHEGIPRKAIGVIRKYHDPISLTTEFNSGGMGKGEMKRTCLMFSSHSEMLVICHF